MFSFSLEASTANNKESKYGIEGFKLCQYYPAPSVERAKEVKEFNFHCGREYQILNIRLEKATCAGRL